MFYDHGFKTGKPDPNPMDDVDFSEAELRMVEFRGLNLDRVPLRPPQKRAVRPSRLQNWMPSHTSWQTAAS